MIIVEQGFTIESRVDGEEILKSIEKAGRVCYKSEDRITEHSAHRFVKMIIDSGHESVIEHCYITVKVICDRGTSHEIVRHRIASYSQESTRYCNYSGEKFSRQVTFIKPYFRDEGTEAGKRKFQIWKDSMEKAEKAYFDLVENGATPEEARSVLPNSLKTELVMTLNLRSWRNFLKLRTSPGAHPQIRRLALSILQKFKELIPVVFDDIRPE